MKHKGELPRVFVVDRQCRRRPHMSRISVSKDVFMPAQPDQEIPSLHVIEINTRNDDNKLPPIPFNTGKSAR